MKNKSLYSLSVILLTVIVQIASLTMIASAMDKAEISGSLRDGYRVLSLTENSKGVSDQQRFTVYRGDYIKFDLTGVSTQALLEIPTLAIRQEITSDLGNTPYIKMKQVGTFPFTLGNITGTITVVEYDQPQYHAVTAMEAVQLIDSTSPLILDVRTPQEYAAGHLENSVLIPVQDLQKRYGELDKYRNEDILIYCATGNRSTVAAKILIDNGFRRIHNLKSGIHDWTRKGYRVVK